MIQSHRHSKAWYIALLGIMFSSFGHPQAHAQFRDFVSPAKSVIHLLYPNLNGLIETEIIDEGHWSSEVQEMNGFYLNLYQVRVSSTGEHVGKAPILRSHFVFSVTAANTELLTAAFSGSACNDERLDQLRKELDSHPEWAESRIAQAMIDSGARYGPQDKAEFVRNLPLRELAPYIGDLELVSADLHLRNAYDDSHRAVLKWFVIAKRRGTANEGRECSFQFEPFGGKLTYLQCE